MQIMAKKVVLQFFVLQAMHHIRKHDEYQRYFLTTYDDSVYSLHFFKWLGVGQTFKNKVESVSRGLGLSNKSEEVSPAACVCMYDNLTKAHSTYSVVFGGTQTHTVELISMDMQSQNPNYVQINNIKRAVMSFVCGLRIEMLGH